MFDVSRSTVRHIAGGPRLSYELLGHLNLAFMPTLFKSCLTYHQLRATVLYQIKCQLKVTVFLPPDPLGNEKASLNNFNDVTLISNYPFV